jgi:hypothetical protein
MRIDAKERSFLEIMSGDRISVPDYQRNYAWKAEQIDAFLSDLMELASQESDHHFFGPVVFLDDEQGNLDLIDGQQRVTTTIMLICLIRDRLAGFENSTLVINGVPIDLIANYIRQMLKLEDFVTDRYIANRQIRDIFKHYILADLQANDRKQLNPGGQGLSDQEKIVTRELRGAYKRLDAALDRWLAEVAGDEQASKEKLNELITAIRKGMRVLEIRMYSEDDAYTLFETLNERGLRLTPSDLLKSFTLKNARQDHSVNYDAVLDKWDDTVAKLGSFPFTTFLRHYLLGRQDKKVQTTKIFSLFRKIIEDYGNGGAVRNLSEIESATSVYSSVLNANVNVGDLATTSAINDSLARINTFSDTHRVYLLRVMGSNANPATKLRAVRATEIVAFRWVLTGGNAQVLESAYQVAANLIDMHDQASVTVSTDKLLESLQSDALVKSAITDAPAKKELCQYVLNRLNYAVAHVGLPHNPSDIHIEHLAPQNPDQSSNWFDRVAQRSSTDPNAATYGDFLTKWGNLTLLEFEINQSIQNSEWDIKLNGQPQHEYKGLKDSHIQITTDVCSISEWTASAIDQRTIWIAEAVIRMTNLDVVNGNFPTIPSFALEKI